MTGQRQRACALAAVGLAALAAVIAAPRVFRARGTGPERSPPASAPAGSVASSNVASSPAPSEGDAAISPGSQEQPEEPPWSLRATDAQGRPVPRFRLQVYRIDGERTSRVFEELVDAEEGMFGLDLDPGRYRYWVLAPEGVWSAERRLRNGERLHLEATLRDNSAIVGRVLSDSGGAIPRAVVTLTDFPRATGAMTQSDGAFRLPVTPGVHSVTIGRRDYSATHVGGLSIGEGQELDIGDVLLLKGSRVEGLVHRRGEPVAGVNVVLQDEKTGWLTRAQTDSSGVFAFAHVRPGTYALNGYALDRVQWTRGLVVSGEAPIFVEIDVEPDAVVEGVVRDALARPVPGVRVQSFDFTHTEVRIAETDLSGRFRAGLGGDGARGMLLFHVRFAGGWVTYRMDLPPATAHPALEIALPGGTVVFRARDMVSGAPIAAEIKLLNPLGLEPAGLKLAGARAIAGERLSHVPSDGWYSITASSQGYAPATELMDLSAPDEERILYLVPEGQQAGGISGIVLDSSGQPIRARIHLLSGDLNAIVAMARSDNSGEFRIEPLAPGSYRVQAEGVQSRWVEHWVEVEPGKVDSDVVLVLEE